MSVINLKPYQYKDKRGIKCKVLPGVNLTLLAGKLKMHRSHLSRVVHGRTRPGIDVLERIKQELGMASVEEAQKWLQRLRVKSRAE